MIENTAGRKDSSTEEKIIEAARKLFTQKGYAATKTRDIAKEAGINSALLNYYFRSKEKLFGIIMRENFQGFIQGMALIANDKKTTFEEKIERIVNNYTDLLLEKPEIPLFVINEIQANPDELLQKLGIEEHILRSHFFSQIQEKAKIAGVNPLHLISNLIGLTIFPFVAGPLLQKVGKFSSDEYRSFLNERRGLIPKWIKAMLQN